MQLPPEEVEEAERRAQEDIEHRYATIPELQGLRPDQDCPVDPSDDVPPPVFREAVRETVVDRLPRPEPEIPPGYALTGMLAYLVTGDDHALHYGPADHDVDLGIMDVTVTVTGEAVTTVDWGDGGEPRTYHHPGRPYPDGEVRYAYADRGTVDIEIVDTWRLTYEVHRDGALLITDAVEFALDPVTLNDFEVRELRAVRTSD